MTTFDDAFIEYIKKSVETRLDGYRLDHSLSVADTAASLADLYGEDASEARVAGLLHDWDKDLSDKELRARVKEYGLDLAPGLMKVPALLHAQTGAIAISHHFPELPGNIIDAVARHTVATVDMTPLDEIIYIADKIEPLRSTRDAEEIRNNVGKVSLRELYIQAYASTLIHLVKRQRRIYPGALKVWNAMVDEIRHI